MLIIGIVASVPTYSSVYPSTIMFLFHFYMIIQDHGTHLFLTGKSKKGEINSLCRVSSVGNGRAPSVGDGRAPSVGDCCVPNVGDGRG